MHAECSCQQGFKESSISFREYVISYLEPLDSLDSEGGDSTCYSHCFFPPD